MYPKILFYFNKYLKGYSIFNTANIEWYFLIIIIIILRNFKNFNQIMVVRIISKTNILVRNMCHGLEMCYLINI